jgi:hypothetical protein
MSIGITILPSSSIFLNADLASIIQSSKINNNSLRPMEKTLFKVDTLRFVSSAFFNTILQYIQGKVNKIHGNFFAYFKWDCMGVIACVKFDFYIHSDSIHSGGNIEW